MLAARLHGPRDLRVEELPTVDPPQSGQVLLDVSSVGVCGSDLHMYETGRIGTTRIETPLVLGHEFAGVVREADSSSTDGEGNPLREGQRVAVDPQVPCGRCRPCQEGHPNLCPNHRFYGVWPDDGALRERMAVEARNCFPIPDTLSGAAGAVLETLGVSMHAVDLGRLRVGWSAAVLGCGPVGLLILQLARLAGADSLYAFDPLPWRASKALELGATDAWTLEDGGASGGVGDVDVVFEAAWADNSIQQAAELARPGGRVVLVGIPPDDRLSLSHSAARRKGLTLVLSRRMKHTYPRAIRLASSGKMDLDGLVSHRLPLEEAARAFSLNADYQQGTQKVVIDVPHP